MQRRWHRPVFWAVVLATAAAAVLLAQRCRSAHVDEEGERADRVGESEASSPVLEPSSVQRRTPAPPARQAGSEPDRPEPSYSFRIGDYRASGIEGVRVTIQRDSSDLKTWRTLAEGVTDFHGMARFTIPDLDKVLPKDGANRRIRVTPPPDRDDLIETWKLWKPTPSTLWDLTELHVVGGRILDSAGQRVAGATVAVGSLDPPGLLKPQWRTTKTDGEGRFKISGIPTTPDGQIDAWCVPPGAELPGRSSEVQGAIRTALGNRGAGVGSAHSSASVRRRPTPLTLQVALQATAIRPI
jgi:hypothetical protein